MWASVTDGGPTSTQPWLQVVVIVRPEPGVAVSAYPRFNIPGGTFKLVSAYRGLR